MYIYVQIYKNVFVHFYFLTRCYPQVERINKLEASQVKLINSETILILEQSIEIISNHSYNHSY